MFRGSGPQRFDRCAVKEITLVPFYQPVEARGNLWEEDKQEGVEHNVRIVAKLQCPKVDANKEVASHANEGKQGAVRDLAAIAGEVVCRNCAFYRMTPIEVHEARTRILEAETSLLRAQIAAEQAKQDYAKLVELGMPDVNALNGQEPDVDPMIQE